MGLLPWGFFGGPVSGNAGSGAWVVSGFGEGGAFISELLGRGTGNTFAWAVDEGPVWLTGGPLARFDVLCWMNDLLAVEINCKFSFCYNNMTQKASIIADVRL